MHAADMLCSISFDRDDEFFATAGVSRRIKVCLPSPSTLSLALYFVRMLHHVNDHQWQSVRAVRSSPRQVVAVMCAAHERLQSFCTMLRRVCSCCTTDALFWGDTTTCLTWEPEEISCCLLYNI